MNFEGWYVDEELTTPYDFNSPLENTITLYAKWTAASASNIEQTPTEQNAQSTEITTVSDSKNPNTNDNIFKYVIMFILSAISIVICLIMIKKISKNNK